MRRLQRRLAFFLKVMVACILSSGMSASAFTATAAGWLGAGGMSDHTVEPELSACFCGLSAEATSIAARPALGRVVAVAGGCAALCADAMDGMPTAMMPTSAAAIKRHFLTSPSLRFW